MDIPNLDDEMKMMVFDDNNCIDIIKYCATHKSNCRRLYDDWITKNQLYGIPLTIDDPANTYLSCRFTADAEREVYRISNPSMSEEELDQVRETTYRNCNRFYNRCKYLHKLRQIILPRDIIDYPIFEYNELVGS